MADDYLTQFTDEFTRQQAKQGSFEDRLITALTLIENAKKVKNYKLNDQSESLDSLLKVIDTQEGMDNFNEHLEDYRLSASGNASHEINANVLETLAERKKGLYTNFSNSIQEASDFINSDQFLDSAEEFHNIQDTIDKKNKELEAKGLKKHSSVADFLQSELSNANRLRDNMVSGFQIQGDEIVGTNFRYNKATTNDKKTFRSLNLYRDRLDLAVKSLAGDGLISIDEAQAILIGDEDNYTTTKNAALRKAESNYKSNNNKASQYDGLINTAKQKKLTSFQDDIMGVVDDQNTAGNLLGAAATGQWDQVIQDLKFERDEHIRRRNEANENYKNWYGSYYESIEGGLNINEIIYDNTDGDDTDGDDMGGDDTDISDDNKVITEKEIKKSFDKHFDRENTTESTNENYQEFSRPNSNKQAKDIAVALGEKNYKDVYNKYLSANPDIGFPPRFDRVGYRPTNIKRETAENYLKEVLNEYNLNISDIANYISNNNSRNLEREFNSFLKKKGVDTFKAREILGNFAFSTYKTMDDPIAKFSARFQPNTIRREGAIWQLSKPVDDGEGWKMVKGFKKGNEKEIKKRLQNYNTVGGYEALTLLYEFIGEKGIK